MSGKQDMHMILTIVPLQQSDIVRWLNALKNLSQPRRDGIINGIAPFFYSENQVVTEIEH